MADGRRRGPRFEFKGVKGAVIFVVLACMLIGYYFYLSNASEKRKGQPTETEITAVQNVLLRNLEIDYPPTPKEVVKYYSELTQCFYNYKLTDEEVKKLADKAKQLYDDELNEKNEEGEYVLNLQKDIDDFNQKGIKISSYVLPASTEVEEFTEGGRECARIYCTYNVRQNSKLQYSRELFVLRREEGGRWKILGWDLAPTEDIE